MILPIFVAAILKWCQIGSSSRFGDFSCLEGSKEQNKIGLRGSLSGCLVDPLGPWPIPFMNKKPNKYYNF